MEQNADGQHDETPHCEAVTGPVGESLSAMLTRHAWEQESAGERDITVQRARSAQLLASVNDGARSELWIFLEKLFQKLDRDRRTGELYAIPIYGILPGGLTGEVERGKAEAEPGEPSCIIVIPSEDAHGVQERKAWLVTDCSQQVWG